MNSLFDTFAIDYFLNALFNFSVRAGRSELHSMAALMGGIASQEVIKILTYQYGIIGSIFFILHNHFS
jgi:hypothetical protein